MKPQWLLPILLLLASCATTRRPQDIRNWLVGTWLMMDRPDDRDLTPCASGLPIYYGGDGKYNMFEESGTWRLEGDRLTEMATEASDVVDPKEVAIGQAFVSRIERVEANAFAKTYADGTKATFRRCPAAP